MSNTLPLSVPESLIPLDQTDQTLPQNPAQQETVKQVPDKKTTAAKPPKSAATIAWKGCTNHLNLLMMTAMGMIPAPKQFGPKYAQDSLRLQVGWWPVFPGTVPAELLNDSIDALPNLLKPCILHLKPDALTTWQQQGLPTRVPAWVGQNWQWLDIARDDFSSVTCMLLPTPISIHLIKNVTVSDKDIVAIFHERLTESNNVLPIEILAKPADFVIKPVPKTQKNLPLSVQLLSRPLPDKFSAPNDDSASYDNAPYRNIESGTNHQPAEQGTQVSFVENSLPVVQSVLALSTTARPVPSNSVNPFVWANSIGAVLAYLSQLANTNDQAMLTLKQLTTQEKCLDDSSAVLYAVSQWIKQSGRHKPADGTGTAFLNLLSGLIDYKDDRRFASFKDIVLYQLQTMKESSTQGSVDKAGEKGIDFIGDLKKLVSFSEDSVETLLERHAKPFTRAVLLFFVLPNVTALWNYQKFAIGALERVMATLLFAIKDGWLALDKSFKNYAGNADIIADIMTQLVHGLPFEETAIRQLSRPLRQILLDETWTKSHENLANALNKQFDWACVNTELVLPSDASLYAKNSQMLARFSGSMEHIKIKTHYDKAQLLDNLLELPTLSFQDEKTLRGSMGKKT